MMLSEDGLLLIMIAGIARKLSNEVKHTVEGSKSKKT